MVLRARANEFPGVYIRWGNFRGPGASQAVLEGLDTRRPLVAEAAVFHGFPSWAEVETYCAAAGHDVPPTRGM